MSRSNWRVGARGRLGLVTNRQLVQSIWLGLLIGLVAGMGAIAFAWSIEFASEHLLGSIAGYHPAQPTGEGGGLESGPDRRWALPLVLTAGGLVAGAIVFLLAPEAEGHGTDAAIDAYHRKAGRVRMRVIPVKLVASAITIGSGGAAGREGPTAQIGGGFGSFIADRFGLGAAERRRALAAGIGAGIGAIFRAPLGGAMMGVEVLYKHDLEAEVILLGLISSIVGYSVYGTWAGWDPIFGGTAGFAFTRPAEIPYYAGLGVVCGALGMLYAGGFYSTMAVFRRIPIPRLLKPALGGLAVGCIGMAAPQAIHVGYGTVQTLMTPAGVEDFSPWLLLALPFLRILTTSLSVGSGGSGGIFGPGMVIGGVVGAVAWRFGHDLPGFPQDPGPVVIVCMIALFGSIAHAPLAMLLMVGEMTGNLSLLAPAMVAVAIATLVVGEKSIYESQVPTRVDSPAHRHRFAFPLLTALSAGRAASPVLEIPASARAADALLSIEAAASQPVVVVERDGTLLETSAAALQAALADDPDATVIAASTRIPAAVPADAPLDAALDQLSENERSWLPVVANDGAVLGAINARSLIRTYRQAVKTRFRPLDWAPGGAQVFDFVVDDLSPVAGMRLRDVLFPDGVRVIAVERETGTVVASGETLIHSGDRLTVACAPGMRETALALFQPRDPAPAVPLPRITPAGQG